MTSLRTNLSVAQIQLALRNSDLFNPRRDLIVPNVSYGMLPYEADLIGITPSGQVTEVEIKRSLEDLRADYRKGHRHDAECVTYFFFCVPECIAEQAKGVILENEQKRSSVPIEQKDCPALLLFTEDGGIRHTGFGTPKRHGYVGSEAADREKAGFLASLHYWNAAERLARPEDFEAKAKIHKLQDENRGLKFIVKNIEEDYDMLKRMLRHRYPQLWREFLETGFSAEQDTSQQKTVDAVGTRRNEFIEDIIRKYHLIVKEGVEIRTRAVCTDSTSSPHPGDNLITEVLYKNHLIAMVYERRDGFNWTETNCIDLKPILD